MWAAVTLKSPVCPCGIRLSSIYNSWPKKEALWDHYSSDLFSVTMLKWAELSTWEEEHSCPQSGGSIPMLNAYLLFSHQFCSYIITHSASSCLQNTGPLVWFQVCNICNLICEWMNHKGLMFYCIYITIKFVIEELHPASMEQSYISDKIVDLLIGFSVYWRSHLRLLKGLF